MVLNYKPAVSGRECEIESVVFPKYLEKGDDARLVWAVCVRK